ncbi:serine-rich protein [Diplodia corticola]|uniref:Serine-rich protein n=1 Tax=Diplodia corticola TaxID=236234 RepID=A0A1J9RUK3_9PEZI|nr:serine-rich protein [Diplodia corticola]OJD31532.1 serine-rich protein [Diplodia corticola]
MAPSRKKLAKARTHPLKRSSDNNDSPKRHQRSQSDVPQTPHSQENRWKRKSRDSRGRSNSVLSPKRRPLRELSPSERNGQTPSPERCEQHISPLTVTEMEQPAQSAQQREQHSVVERPERGSPSGTYFKSPFPLHPSQVLLPSPATTPSFFITYDDGPATDDGSPAEEEDSPAEEEEEEEDSPAEEEEDDLEVRDFCEPSVGTSDAPEFFKDLVVGPSPAESRRTSIDTTTASTEDDDSLPYPISFSRLSSDLYGSVNSRTSMMQSTVRSIQPSEEYKSATSVRSSASSETLSTRQHDGRKSTASNWTVHAHMSSSTRPTSTNPRTPSPFGISSTPTPQYGPHSPGVSQDKRPVSTFGNPLTPYLDNDCALRPVSASDAYSGKVSNFGSSDELLADLTPPTRFTPSWNSTATKAFQATSNPDNHHQEVCSVSGMSTTTTEEIEPAALCMPKRVARSNQRQNWTARLPSTSTQPEPIQPLPTIPSSSHSVPPTEFSSRATANPSLVSLPTMRLEGSLPSSRPQTQDRGEESSATAAARAELPPLRNPWQSVDSTSFFNLMMGRGNDNGGNSGASSRPATRASRSSSAATVLYAAKGLPAWARSFYSTGDPSVIGSSSRPSTRSKPSQSSLRQPNTSGSGSNGSEKQNNRYGSRAGSSSRPTNTAPTDSPASSQFSIASIQRPRNRPHSTIYSENWTPSPHLAAEATSDEESSNSTTYSSSADDSASDGASSFGNYSAGIESHHPSTAHSNATTGGLPSRHQYQPQLRNISDVPTAADDSMHGTQRRFPSRMWHWAASTMGSTHSGGRNASNRAPPPPLRYFGPSGPESNQTPRLRRDQSSAYYANSTATKSFRYLRPSSWVCGNSNNGDTSDNPNRPAADRQVWLFVLGFLVPFAWMLAALLPVPEKKTKKMKKKEKKEKRGSHHHGGGGGGGAAASAAYTRHGEEKEEGRRDVEEEEEEEEEDRDGAEGAGAGRSRHQQRYYHYRRDERDGDAGVEAEDGSGGVVDVEAQMEAAQMEVLMERERVRAVWWRRLNRRMSVVGVAVVVVVVVVVAVTLTA